MENHQNWPKNEEVRGYVSSFLGVNLHSSHLSSYRVLKFKTELSRVEWGIFELIQVSSLEHLYYSFRARVSSQVELTG